MEAATLGEDARRGEDADDVEAELRSSYLSPCGGSLTVSGSAKLAFGERRLVRLLLRRRDKPDAPARSEASS